MKNIEIHSILGNYPVIFDQELDSLKSFLEDTEVVFLIDEKVFKLYNGWFNQIPVFRLILIKASEKSKSYHSIGKIYERLTSFQGKRNLKLVGIGGGVVQDISGFIASTLYRGIKWIYFPTTLLAQADSCIGAKTSLNFGNFKNLIGTFYAPEKIILSTKFLDTLPRKAFFSGIGEIIKLFLIDGEKSLKCLRNIPFQGEPGLRKNIESLLIQSLEIKKRFIEADEFDQGIRNILNFGHCIGHALESVTNYKIPHGQAVTLGMIWANLISEKMMMLSLLNRDIIYNTYLKNNHTVSKNAITFNPDLIVTAMKKDKKRVGADLAIILMNDENNFKKIIDLKEEIILETYNEFISFF